MISRPRDARPGSHRLPPPHVGGVVFGVWGKGFGRARKACIAFDFVAVTAEIGTWSRQGPLLTRQLCTFCCGPLTLSALTAVEVKEMQIQHGFCRVPRHIKIKNWCRPTYFGEFLLGVRSQ